MEFTSGRTVGSTKENTKEIKSMGLALIYIQMVVNSKENGKMDSRMGKGICTIRTAKIKGKENGRKENFKIGLTECDIVL